MEYSNPQRFHFEIQPKSNPHLQNGKLEPVFRRQNPTRRRGSG